MGRQRVIDDISFWRSPHIAECSQEEKATLLYLLTSPSSNIVGVYQIVPRISAAEMGWTAEQLMTVVARLESLGLVRYERATSHVWVTVWWEHNSIKLAFAPKLRDKAISQLAQMPRTWADDFFADVRTRSSEIFEVLRASELSTRNAADTRLASADTVSIPYPRSQDGASDEVRPNVRSKTISNESFKGIAPAPAPTARTEPLRNGAIAKIELEKIRGFTLQSP